MKYVYVTTGAGVTIISILVMCILTIKWYCCKISQIGSTLKLFFLCYILNYYYMVYTAIVGLRAGSFLNKY